MVSAETLRNPKDQFQEADLVIIGIVVEMEQDVDTTTALIKIEEVLKGDSASLHVSVVSGTGRVYVSSDQPLFSGQQKSLLFLKKQDDVFTCLDGANGQKVILNDNVYPYAHNIMYSVPLKTYLKDLDLPKKNK